MPDYQTKNLEKIEKKVDALILKFNDLLDKHKENPTHAIIEARKSIERICKFIITIEGLSEKDEKILQLNEMIKLISRVKKSTPAIIISMRTIQHYGNIGAHDQDEYELPDRAALICLEHLSVVINWFLDTYRMTGITQIETRSMINENGPIALRITNQRRNSILTVSKSEFELYQAIYVNTRSASVAPTFDGARILLARIDITNVKDPELVSYFEHSRDLVEFCIDTGIGRDAHYSIVGVLKTINKAAFIRYLIKKGPLRMMEHAIKLRNQGEKYFQLDAALASRYGYEG